MAAKKIIHAAALTVLFLAGSAAAQTSSSSPATTASPGTPNTGSGGNAAVNILVLTGSAAVALSGLAYLARRRTI